MLDSVAIINLVGFLVIVGALVVAISLADPDRRLRPIQWGLWFTCAAAGAEFLPVVQAVRPSMAVRYLLDAAWLATSLCWLVVLQSYGKRGFELRRSASALEHWLFALAILAYACTIAWRAAEGVLERPPFPGAQQLRAPVTVLVPIIGLILCENLYRNATEDFRWRLKFLNFAVVVMLTFDLSVALHESLHLGKNTELFRSRALVMFLTVPLILSACSRLTRPVPRYAVSRNFVFYSTAALLGGIYLLVVALIAYYVQFVGTSLAVPLQIIVVLAGVAALLAVLSSGSLRAKVRAAIAAAIYDLKYDYRAEWLRFINTISAEGTRAGLQERLIKSVADVVDSIGGALWEWDETAGLFVQTAEWNYTAAIGKNVDDAAWLRQLRAGLLVRGESFARLAPSDQGFDLTDVWLILPLPHGEQLSGFIVLRQCRIPRVVDGEDEVLLGILVRQIASYLAEYRGTVALAEQKELKEFSERVTFVAHDIKSIIYQLSLMVDNAKQVGENPEFQRDMLLTIGDSIGKMQQMLLQLRKDYADASTVINLRELIDDIVQRFRDSGAAIELSAGEGALQITAGRSAIESVFRQLIANATEAAAADGAVRIALALDGPWVAVTIADTGAGMDPGFVREHLFRPLRSSKPGGYGVGMYQVRELLRKASGRIRVRSTPGMGTTVEVLLPATHSASSEQG
jgi:putative PEP-CTERM system histidine kinase